MKGTVERRPTQYELPYSDDRVMESEIHAMQLPLLKETLQRHWSGRDDYYIGIDMFVYFSETQEKNYDFRGPDVFVVQGVKTDPNAPRLSFVTWDEGKSPDVIIEITSPSTAKIDKVLKKGIYQDKLKVPEYFWFDPFSDDFRGFELKNGKYAAIEPIGEGVFPSKQLGLNLMRWHGEYCGAVSDWLRWTTTKGILLPTGAEVANIEKRRASNNESKAKEERKRADEERHRAEEERNRAEEERKRADVLEALLRRHGIDPNSK